LVEVRILRSIEREIEGENRRLAMRASSDARERMGREKMVSAGEEPPARLKQK
jgi:hypothetical protein